MAARRAYSQAEVEWLQLMSYDFSWDEMLGSDVPSGRLRGVRRSATAPLIRLISKTEASLRIFG